MNHDFLVGDWLIEPDLNRISTAGTIVPIEPKVMELLVHLSSHPNQVLSKQEIIKAVWPDTFVGDEVLLVAQILDNLGRRPEAEAARRRGVRIVEAKLKLDPDDSRALYIGANGLVALGDIERGISWAGQALALDPEEPMVLYNVACIQSLAGKTSDALDSLERAVHNGLTQKSWLERDSNLDPLRKDRRFKSLIQRLAKNPSAT